MLGCFFRVRDWRGRLRDWRSFARGGEGERDEITCAHWGKPGFFLPFSLGTGGRSVGCGIAGVRTMDHGEMLPQNDVYPLVFLVVM